MRLVETNAHDAVAALEQRRVDATNSKDYEAMKEIISRDFIQIHTSGRIDDADAFLDGLSGGRQIIEREVEIKIFDNAAVITGPQTIDFNEVPARVSKMQCTLVANRFEGEWRFVLLQATIVLA